jgi:hypothetical protein
MTAKFLVGDVFDRLAEIPDDSVELVLTSPPFLALRSYLPDDHPDKTKEIGSETTPAEFLDTMLALTAEWGRVLAPHGSIAIELGDTYAGSGGAGGDYDPDGMRSGQPRFRQGYDRRDGRTTLQQADYKAPLPVRAASGDGWPRPKSLCGIPTLYAWCLAYGRNLLTGEPSPAGMWLVRNVKPWIRSNPPVGALGDKERPATSYVVVATKARDRYFDLDAVRTAGTTSPQRRYSVEWGKRGGDEKAIKYGDTYLSDEPTQFGNPAGAPPRDWWHHVDAVLDAALEEYAGGTTHARAPKGTRRTTTGKAAANERGGNWMTLDTLGEADGDTQTIRGVHLRRALERAGILTTVDAVDVSPKGYAGAHYAVWPAELVRLLVDEMCPRRVCTACGQPSRRIIETGYVDANGQPAPGEKWSSGIADGKGAHSNKKATRTTTTTTLGWSDCGCSDDGSHWRPGLVLDPFVGSGTTLAVCTGMGRDSIGLDLDSRNAYLALERVGMFLDIDDPAAVPDA